MLKEPGRVPAPDGSGDPGDALDMLDRMGEGSDVAPTVDAPGHGSADASSGPADAGPDAPDRRGWIHRTWDRIPTAWFATLATALFLAVTAAFGGLATVPDPVLALHPGEPFEGAGFEMTVTGAKIVDARKATQLTPKPGERVLLVALDARVTGHAPRQTSTTGSLTEIRVQGVIGKPAIIRSDDGTLAPTLQPDVTSPVLLAWVVPASLADQQIRIRLPLATQQQNHIGSGTRWDFDRFGATVTVAVADGGSGDRQDGT